MDGGEEAKRRAGERTYGVEEEAERRGLKRMEVAAGEERRRRRRRLVMAKRARGGGGFTAVVVTMGIDGQ
jgi:hypothetical protein